MNGNRKNVQQLDDALNECFESMVKGESLDSCLIKHSEFSSELRPLLETMQAARSAGEISPEPAFRAAARYEFRKALYDDTARRTRPALSLRLATIAASLGVFLMTGAGGTLAASSGSMPGQLLYQVKRNIENTQLTLAASQSDKARLYATLADRRISEIVYTAESGDVLLTESLTRDFTSDLAMVYQTAAVKRETNNSGDTIIFASSGTDSTKGSSFAGTDSSGSQFVPPAVTTTMAVPASAPGIGTVTSGSSPVTMDTTSTATAAISGTGTPSVITPGSIQGPVPLDNITDPALLKLLKEYSIKNIAELTAILDKVPSSTNAPLMAALQAAISAYGEILGE